MVLTASDLNLIRPYCVGSMFELGAQLLAEDWSPAKRLFERWGLRHVSMDASGARGALQRSITEAVDNLGTFNVVTDFGASANILDQEATFANLHRLCAPGGVMVHVVPWYRSVSRFP